MALCMYDRIHVVYTSCDVIDTTIYGVYPHFPALHPKAGERMPWSVVVQQ